MTNGFRENREENPFNLQYLNEVKEYGIISEFETTNNVSEEAIIKTAFLAGIRDENSLTNKVFFSRHRELREDVPLKPHQKELIKEWLGIRDKIVRPILADLKKSETQTPTEYTSKRSSIDQSILSRLNAFQCKSFAETISISLDRLKNQWYVNYTYDVIHSAALISLIKYMYDNPPTPNEIVTKIQSLRDQKRFGFTYDMMDEPPAVMPIYELWVSWDKVDLLINPNSKLNKNGKNIYASCVLGEFFNSVFKYALERWDNIKPFLRSNTPFTPDRIYYIIKDPLFRRYTIDIGKTHRSTSNLRKIFNADSKLAAYQRDPTHADFKGIQDKEWATILSDLTYIAHQQNSKRISDLKIRREKHFINEALRPHLIQLSPSNIISFIGDTYKHNSTVTLNYHKIKLEAGQKLTNAKGDKLFLLACYSDHVIYQNEEDKMFYKQSVSGIDLEMQYQIFGLFAQKADYVMQLIKFPIGIMTAIFPPARYVYLSANVLNTSNRIYYHWNDLETLYKNIKICINNIEKLVPGMMGIILAAIPLALHTAAKKMLNPKEMEIPLDKWLIAILQISMTLVANYYQGKIFSDTAITVLAKIWDSIKSVVIVIKTVLSNSVIPLLITIHGRKDKNIENNVADLSLQLAKIGLKNTMQYARTLLAHTLPTMESLIIEITELERNGSEMINLLRKCASL